MAGTAHPEKMNSGAIPGGMFVQSLGEGPPVLLIHGLGGPAMWERVVPLLAASRRVILPHLPGFGDGPPPKGEMSSNDHALLIRAMLTDKGLSNVTVVGISYGGAVAALLAAHSADIVTKLILLCPTGFTGHAGYLPAMIMRGYIGGMLLRWALSNRRLADLASLRSFHDPSCRPPDLLDRYLARLARPGNLTALADALREISRRGPFLRELAPLLPGDTVVVWGEHDRVLPLRTVSGTGSRWIGDRLILLRRCGHSIPLEDPDGIVRLITGGTEIPDQGHRW